MSKTKRQHPYQILAQMDELCIRIADTFPSEAKSVEFWKGIGFALGGNKYITPWDEVAEIQSLPPTTRVPGAKDWVRGVANVRGTLLPVMDLNVFLGYRPRKLRKQRLLVVKHDGIYCGLIVDEILGAMTFEQFEQLEELPAVDEPVGKFITGGFTRQDDDWPVFSLHSLAEYDDFRQVTR